MVTSRKVRSATHAMAKNTAGRTSGTRMYQIICMVEVPQVRATSSNSFWTWMSDALVILVVKDRWFRILATMMMPSVPITGNTGQ